MPKTPLIIGFEHFSVEIKSLQFFYFKIPEIWESIEFGEILKTWSVKQRKLLRVLNIRTWDDKRTLNYRDSNRNLSSELHGFLVFFGGVGYSQTSRPLEFLPRKP